MKNKLVLPIVLAVFALFAVIAVPSVSAAYPANAIYLYPEDSSGLYCNDNTLVEVRINASVSSIGAQTDIYFDPSCVNITGADFTGSSWPGKLWHYGNYVRLIGFGTAPAGDNLFANITLHCVDPDSCKSDLGFSGAIVVDGLGESIDLTPYNGTFRSGKIYLEPEDSSGLYCENNTDVVVKINVCDSTVGAQTDIYFDPSCVNITGADFTGSSWPGKLWHYGNYVRLIGFGTAPAGDNLFANITLHCVDPDSCKSDLGFSGAIVVDGLGESIDLTPYNGTFTCGTASYVFSSDDTGKEQNTFDLTEDVYCYAGNLPANTDVRIYVVANKDVWNDGAPLADVSGEYETKTTESDGSIATTKIWSATLTEGDYDIVVDTNRNGKWNTGEPIDSEVDVGFTAVPEFTTIVIPVAAIFGLVFLMSRRSRHSKRKN